MESHERDSSINKIISEIKHFLPAQAPLKDFVHHNTLHAFQDLKFSTALHKASEIFGYKLTLPLHEFRELYYSKSISDTVLERAISERWGKELIPEWKERLLKKDYDLSSNPRIGSLRANWKKQYHYDLDSQVHPILFRILCSYLDQGISIWSFPQTEGGFLTSIRNIEQSSLSSFFRTPEAKALLLTEKPSIKSLLTRIVGDETLFEHYLYDQQFAHQGWSGMVSSIENEPHTLVDKREISLHDVILFELLLEYDALKYQFKNRFQPLSTKIRHFPGHIFSHVPETELYEVMTIWQEAFEWTYYDQVLTGIKISENDSKEVVNKSFQAMFCIDDREGSLRRYLEKYDPRCETFGTPGFFGVEFYYQPEHGKSYTKLCPAPVTPKYLIKEIGGPKSKRKKDVYFTKRAHALAPGWIIAQTLGILAAFRLFINIFRPSMGAAVATSLRHMHKKSRLTIVNSDLENRENDLQIGFTYAEMAVRIEGLLKSIGLVKDFAPVVYIIGHGSSTANNPHYAAYDCGACCGRPGSVNARVAASMANHPNVRALLAEKGIVIPESTQFVGGLHDTTRDEVVFYDEHELISDNLNHHSKNQETFLKALTDNAKERSRRFESINPKLSAEKIHKKVGLRSVSLFQPRPELNHATNALCVVGRRNLTKGLFLDRRSFMNSYDYKIDPDGKYLLNILKAAAPVCGGINLEYFFSRVDNQKLGAGTKLPHNVMGLFGVANGIDGDLRPGLPSQMIEIHDPVRLLMIVEHLPEVVLETIKILPETYEWFQNEWVNLVVVHPEKHEMFRFKDGDFVPYNSTYSNVNRIADLNSIIEGHRENLPVYSI